MNTKTIGSLNDCDLVLNDDSVSPIHAQAQLDQDGFISVLDAGSDQGTFLERNGHWVRVLKIGLGSTDRIRCGQQVLELKQITDLFGEQVRVQFRDSQHLRMPAMLADRLAKADSRVRLERPKRNPETGDIEEDL
jgi:hypothetical protein